MVPLYLGGNFSLVILHHLALVVSEAFPAYFASISMFTDSMCSLGALQKEGGVLRLFFGNRVSEIKQLWERLLEFTGDLAPVWHVPGLMNPADLGTRGRVSPQVLGPDSVWQCGPKFLLSPFSEWPAVSSENVAAAAPPVEEIKTSLTVSTVSAPSKKKGLCKVFEDALVAGSHLGKSLVAMVECMLTREKLETSTRALARVISAVVRNDRESCAKEPSPRMIEIAVHLLLQASSEASKAAWVQGKLRSLGAFEKGEIVWISGRVHGERLAELLWTSHLPILMGSEQLSKSILRKAHRQDHRRNPRDIAARFFQATCLDSGCYQVCEEDGKPVLPMPTQGQEGCQAAHRYPARRKNLDLGSLRGYSIGSFRALPGSRCRQGKENFQMLGCRVYLHELKSSISTPLPWILYSRVHDHAQTFHGNLRTA